MMSQSAFPANRIALHNAPLNIAIAIAFRHNSSQLIGPGWIVDACYDIDAKAEGEQALTLDQMRPLMQNLLKQRLGLVVHHDQRTVAGYALVLTKAAPKLQAASAKGDDHLYILQNGIDIRRRTVASLAGALASAAGAPVVDETGILGTYDFRMRYATVQSPDASLPDLFTAVQEQLGLKLEPRKVPVDYLMIDHVDRVPSDN